MNLQIKATIMMALFIASQSKVSKMMRKENKTYFKDYANIRFRRKPGLQKCSNAKYSSERYCLFLKNFKRIYDNCLLLFHFISC